MASSPFSRWRRRIRPAILLPEPHVAMHSYEIFRVRTSHGTAPSSQPSSAFPIKLSSASRVLQFFCIASKKKSLGVHLFQKGEWMASCRAASVTSSNFSQKLIWSLQTLFRSVGSENQSKLHCHTPGTSMSYSRSCRILLSWGAGFFFFSDTHTWLVTAQ